MDDYYGDNYGGDDYYGDYNYATGTPTDDSWYWEMIGIDPSTTGDWTSPTAEELEGITNPPSTFGFKLNEILSGKKGLPAQLLGLGGISSLLNKLLGGGGGGGFAGYKGGIPSYTASRQMLPIPTTTTNAAGQTTPRRPGQGGIQYFSPMTYGTPAAPPQNTETVADGGLIGYGTGGIASLGGYSDGGRLLKGPGDGTSDSIPATIGVNKKPARLADGEFVVDARTVSELGNGSTDAGAKKLYAMMNRVHSARKKAKRGQNTKADKYLPA